MSDDSPVNGGTSSPSEAEEKPVEENSAPVTNDHAPTETTLVEPTHVEPALPEQPIPEAPALVEELIPEAPALVEELIPEAPALVEELIVETPELVEEVFLEPVQEVPETSAGTQLFEVVPSVEQSIEDISSNELIQLKPVAIDLPIPAAPDLPLTMTLASLESPKPTMELPKIPRCLNKTPRKSSYSSNILTQAEITREILARAEKKRQQFPDAMDVLVAMKSSSSIRIPKFDHSQARPSPPKLPKLRDDDKKLDAKDLLMILQDGADGESDNRRKSPAKKPRAKLDLKIDPELERQLALKQLQEFSTRKTERRPRNSNNNVEKKEMKKEDIKKEKDIKKEPVKKEPVKKEPVKKEPVKKEPIKKGPVKKEPAKRVGRPPKNKEVQNNQVTKNAKVVKNSKEVKKVTITKKTAEEKGTKKTVEEKDTKKEKEVVVKQEKPDESKCEEEKRPKKRLSTANGPPPKRGPNRELHRLLQDEGAINMLYDVEKGESAESKDRLSSKRRLKKVLKKKAMEVEAAILTATSSTGSHRSLRTSEKRKHSIESVESATTGPESTTEPESSEPPPVPQEGEAATNTSARHNLPHSSKIIRRHSSSSSYSSRGSSPRRMSLDRDRSPSAGSTDIKLEMPSEIKLEPGISSTCCLTPSYNDDSLHQPQDKSKISERAEKLIEMKVRELNLQPHHGAIIKQLIVEKKNGLKERLQSEFAVKFKAALSPKTSSPEGSVAEASLKPPGVVLNAAAVKQLKAKAYNLVNVRPPTPPLEPATVTAAPPEEAVTPSKPAWKTLVEEDWGDSGDELDPDDPPPTKSAQVARMEKRRISSKAMEADICSLAERLAAQIKAGNALVKAPIGSVRAKLSTPVPLVNPKVEAEESDDEDPTSTAEELSIPSGVSGPTPGSDVRLERMNAIIRLYIKPTSCRLPNSLSCKVLNELTQALDYLETSSDTRVIVLVWPPLHEAMTAITESEHEGDFREQPPDFCAGRISPTPRQQIIEVLPTDKVNHCNGIDLLALCADSAEKRRKAATETANAIKDLTFKLATCSRLVCTAVSGKAIGLSVVLLAYCDFVLADETATFSTPYAELGYLPEAAAAHTLPLVIGKKKTNWLLLGNGTLTATEAEVCGLVTRVVPRQSVLAHELCVLARNISATSLLATESAKGMINHSIKSTIGNTLRTEAKVLETHWSAPDTQHRMKNFAVQLILDMHNDQWKRRESHTAESEVEVSFSRTPAASEPAAEEFEVPATNLVFEEPSDHLGIEPEPVDDLHFDDPTTITLELPSAHLDHSYELKQLR